MRISLGIILIPVGLALYLYKICAINSWTAFSGVLILLLLFTSIILLMIDRTLAYNFSKKTTFIIELVAAALIITIIAWGK